MDSPAPEIAPEKAAAGERRNPLLMIGLDAAESTLIQKWMRDGLLPNLSGLLMRGAWVPLDPSAGWVVGGLWPSFYTSSSIERFGLYHYLVWRPDRMTTERPEPEWMPLEPFWRELPGLGRRVIAVDVPLSYPPIGSKGVELSGWATHEQLLAPASSPAGLLNDIRGEFGDPPLGGEAVDQLTAEQFLDVRDQCVENARRVGEGGCALMQRHAWDFSLICLSSIHRAGHQLWDRTILKGTTTPSQVEAIDRALRDVYVACDSAVGRLIEQAGEGAAVMVFALHGMGPNSDRTNLLPEMLARVLDDRRSEGEPIRAARLTDRLRRLVPAAWRARVKQSLPRALQDKLTVYWRAPRRDWSRTRAFVTFCDLDGYIRINLKGRERDGIVASEDYGPLCERIAAGLSTFRDADTGQPLVAEIVFADQVFAEGPMRDLLPDLIVRWNDSSATAHRRIVSQRYGSIPWPTPGCHPHRRSGNHRRQGFLIAGGGAFRRGLLADHAGIVDLAPTALSLLGLPTPATFIGKSVLLGEP
jgi:predicted AlkP superfamily phosphohydrolase/phosphomutase